MKYTTSLENKWTSSWRDSDFFYAGIEVTPSHIQIDVSECNSKTTKTISFRPTIPVVPEGSSSTDYVPVTIYIPHKFLNQDRQSAVDDCELKMKGTAITQLKIKGICDNQDDKAPSLLEYHFGFLDTHPFWGFYRLPSVRVSVQNTPTRECRSVSDPRYTTFDGWSYSAMDPGNYVLFSDSTKNIEIHSRVWLCSGFDGACNCGLAIREGNDVIVVSVCNSLLTYSQPNHLRTQIRSTGPLARGTHIYKKGRGSSVTITVILPSGIRVKVFRYSWGLGLYIYAFGGSSNRISGLCGNFNDKQNDDFNNINGGDKKNHADAASFTNSWRILPQRSYFELLPSIVRLPVTGHSCFCPILKTVHDVTECEPTATYFQDFDNDKGEDITGNMARSARSVRETVYTDDIIEFEERGFFKDSQESHFAEARIRSKRQIDDRSFFSKENATKYCKSAIEDSIGGKVCNDLVGTNLTVFVMECVADLMLTGDPRFVESAFDSMKNGCEEEALRNVSLFKRDSNGTLHPPEEIGNVLCPNDCSNHGNCTNRTCICEEGFTTADCSMATNTVPELLGIYDGGLCDIRRRPCKKTDLFGQDFIDSKNLTCHVQEFKVMRLASIWVPKAYTVKFPGKMLDLFGVKCNLPDPPTRLGDFDHEGTPVGGLWISISNDGLHKSPQQMRFVSYDSRCINCNKSSNCTLREDSCLINGHCFSDKEPNPRDWCQQCMPGHSQHKWKPRIANNPPQFARNQSTRYAIQGEYLPLQLRATDPDNRPVTYSLIGYTAVGYTFSPTGLFKWNVTSQHNHKFEFKVTDECNASDTITITIRVVICPCQHGGKCSPHPFHPRGSGQYSCKCVTGFKGDRCETNIDDCVGVNCGNGSCVDGVNNHTCSCRVGFAGSLCDQRLTRCTNQTCFPGVPCSEIPNGISCGPCPVGFTGDGKTCVDTSPPSSTATPTTEQASSGPSSTAPPTTEQASSGPSSTAPPTTEQVTSEPLSTTQPTTEPDTTEAREPTTSTSVTSGSFKLRAEIHIKKKWIEDYREKNSKAFLSLANQLKQEILKAFKQAENKNLKKVEVISFSPGSVIAEFELVFEKQEKDPLAALKASAQNDTLGNLEVDYSSLKIKSNKKEPKAKDNVVLIAVLAVVGALIVALVIAFIAYLIRKKKNSASQGLLKKKRFLDRKIRSENNDYEMEESCGKDRRENPGTKTNDRGFDNVGFKKT